MAKAAACTPVAAAAIAAFCMILFAAPLTEAAARAPGTGFISELRLRSDEPSSCGVTATEVGNSFDAYNEGECADDELLTCCRYFAEDLAYLSGSESAIPNFTWGCRSAVRSAGPDGLCGLVEDQPDTYGVLQPLLDRCENLREPCTKVEPPPPCDTSLPTVDAAVSGAYNTLRACGSGGVTKQCTDQGSAVPYDCPQSGVCSNGDRCSFAPSRGEEIACCNLAVEGLLAAVPCLDVCGIYGISRKANNFLTACTDVSKC